MFRGLLAALNVADDSGIGGKNDHVVDPAGSDLLPHRRPCRRSSRSDQPLFSTLLADLDGVGVTHRETVRWSSATTDVAGRQL